MTLNPTLQHLTAQLTQLTAKETRLIEELTECQNTIASHQAVIKMIEDADTNKQSKPTDTL